MWVRFAEHLVKSATDHEQNVLIPTKNVKKISAFKCLLDKLHHLVTIHYDDLRNLPTLSAKITQTETYLPLNFCKVVAR